MDLRALAAPRGTAGFGTSEDHGKIGGRPPAFLLRAGFGGPIRPVNPRDGTGQGLPALTRIGNLPGDGDLAVLAVPGAAVPPSVAVPGARGVRATVFAQDPDAPAEAALLGTARLAGVRLPGPNTLGLFSTGSGCFATFSTALDGVSRRSGPATVLNQSGAFGSYLCVPIGAAGAGIRHLITTGNGPDLDRLELPEAPAGDDDTTTVVQAIGGLGDGRRPMAAIRALRSAGKSVVAMKSGRSEGGQRAAATHAGALAREDAVLAAALSAPPACRGLRHRRPHRPRDGVAVARPAGREHRLRALSRARPEWKGQASGWKSAKLTAPCASRRRRVRSPSACSRRTRPSASPSPRTSAG